MTGLLRFATGMLCICLLLTRPLYAEDGPEELLKYDWIEVRSDDIVIITDASEKRAVSFLSDLQKFKQVVLFTLAIKQKANVPPLTVYAFSRSENFKRFVEEKENLAGYFSQSFMNDYAVVDLSGYSSGKRANYARYILFHEYVHYIFRSYFLIRGIPLWYQEGFADFLSSTTFDKKTASVGVANEFRLFDINTHFEVATLFNHIERPHTRTASTRFYDQSYAVVHYLNMNQEYRPKIDGFIDRLYKGASMQTAFEESFGRTFDQFDVELLRYIKRNKYPYWRFDESDGLTLSDAANYQTRTLPSAEFAMHIGKILYSYGNNDAFSQQAFAITDHAIGLDNTLVNAYGYQALYRLGEDRKEEARAAIDTALQIEPESPWINTVYGIWLLDHAEQQFAAGDIEWMNTAREARGKFRLAIHKDKSSALAYAGLGDVYLMLQDNTGLDEGILAYNQAIYLMPMHETVYKLAVLYARNNENVDAVDLLTHVVRDSDIEELVIASRELLLSIDPDALKAGDSTGPESVEPGTL